MKMIQKGLFRVFFNQFNGNTMLNCCTTCIPWEIGSYETQQSRHNEHMQFCRKICNNLLFGIFQNFIRFGGTNNFVLV